MPCNAGVIIGGYMFKERGSFVTLDTDMFVHTVTGREDLAPSKYKDASYITTSIVTDSVPITQSNSADMSDRLWSRCFDTTDRSSWDANHRADAVRAWDMIDWKLPFDLAVWLETHAAGDEDQGAWARYLLEHPFVRVYIMCLHTAVLLKHYSWSAIDKMPALDRGELLKLLTVNPYVLCFKHLYAKQFPTLPELKLEHLEWKTQRKIGADKIANVWLYRALQATEKCHGDTHTEIEKHGRRYHVKLGRGDDIDANNRTFRHILAGFNKRERKNDADDLLPKLINDAGPVIERLEAQDSIFVQNNRVMIRGTWDQTAFIARSLREFAKRKKEETKGETPFQTPATGQAVVMEEKKVPLSLSERLVNESAEYTDDFWHQLALQGETKQAAKPPEGAKPPAELKTPNYGAAVVNSLCDEQKNAHAMVLKNPVSIIVGPGGSGKTEVVRAIDGRGECIWPGGIGDVLARPNDFFTKGNAHLAAIEEARLDEEKASKLQKRLEGMVYLEKAHMMVVTPTGKAAKVATDRSARRAHTAQFVIVYDKHNPGRFDQVRTLTIDEAGMFDEDQFADLLATTSKWPMLERIVVMGDYRQLRSVGKGQILIDLLKSWIPRAELTINHRVKPNSRKLADIGKAIALERYDDVIPDGKVFMAVREFDLPLKTLAQKYKDCPRDCQVMTFTRACRSRINRAFMIEYGFAEAADYKLSGKDGKQEWMTPNPLPVSTGQKIVITKNIRKPDQYDVQNGQIEIVVDIWDVDADAYDKAKAIDRVTPNGPRAVDGLTKKSVKHTDAVSVFKNHKRFMRFESGMVVPAARELLGKIVPGYGVTVHTMQGDSVKDAYLLVESAAPVDREMTYTAVTRGTESFTFMFDSVYGSINGMIMSAVSKQRPERRTLLAEFIGKDVDVPPQQQTTCSFCSTVFPFHVTAEVPWRTMCDKCTIATAALPKAVVAERSVPEDEDADEPMQQKQETKPRPSLPVTAGLRPIDPFELNDD